MEFKCINNIQDLTNNLNLRYSSIQKVLIDKFNIKDVFSIKNMGSEQSTLIGLVKSVKESVDKIVIEIEDPTGAINVSLPKIVVPTKVKDDDIIAVTGKLVGNIFEAELLVWPDVPLRSATKGKGKIVFLSNITIDEKIIETLRTADYVFVENCRGWEDAALKSYAQWVVVGESLGKTKNVTVIKNPSLVEAGGLIVLIYFNQEPVTDVLRRRFIQLNNSDFIIDSAPDIVFSETKEHMNYKGITIIGNGSIDGETRDVQEKF